MWTAFLDQLAAVLHAFRQNKGRSLLTLLGMIIGAGSVVLLSGLLAGGEEALVNTNQFIGDADVIEVETQDAPPQQRGRTQRPLSNPDVSDLHGSPSVGGASAEGELFDWSKWARYGAQKKRVMILGATADSMALYRVKLKLGRYLDEADLRQGARVCVVGHEVWEELLGAPQDLRGVAVRLGNVRWEVVGVLQHKPALNAGPGVWMWDRRVVVPSTTFQGAVRHARKVDTIYIRVLPGLGDIAQRVQSVQGLVKEVLKRRHYGVENFRMEGEKGEKQQEQMIFLVINMLMLATSALSLFVGGINIMNIMLVTVTERTREIGVRRALGATKGNILRQFLLESAIVAGLGGVAGVLSGVAMVFLVSKGLALWLGSWTAHYKLWAMALGLGSSTLTGIVFGLYPAWRAAGLDPVEALRHE